MKTKAFGERVFCTECGAKLVEVTYRGNESVYLACSDRFKYGSPLTHDFFVTDKKANIPNKFDPITGERIT